VWNAHNTVFGSKHPAICALAVYFLHSTRLSVTWLNSRSSLAACDWLLSALSAVPSTRVRRRKKFWGRFIVRNVQVREWLWIDSNGKNGNLTSRIEGSFGNEFPSIYNHCGVMKAWSRKTIEKMIFFAFLEKRPLMGKFSKFDRRVVFKFREIWPTGNR